MNQITVVDMLKWERRSIVLAAFGLVGFGAVVGAGAVYWLVVKQKIENIFQIQSVIIHELQNDVENLKRSSSLAVSVPASPISPSTRAAKTPKPLGEEPFSDEEEAYLTANSSEDEDAEDKRAARKTKRASSTKSEMREDEWAQVEVFLEKIDKLLEGSIVEQHEAFNTLKINKDKLQNSCDFWWRYAKATHLEASVAQNNGDKQLRKTHIEMACSHAEKALQLDENSSDAHKWFAITVGNRSEYLSLNDRIQSGFTFKQHVDKAVTLNPKDGACYHLLGRFCLEVSQLTWIERKVAATLFSNPPSATVKEALDNFQEAEKIKPFLENRLFMAKCYINMGDNKRAAKWLDMALQMPVLSMSDKTAQTEATQLFQKYRKHLS